MFNLYDGTTDLGRLGQVGGFVGSATDVISVAFFGRRFFTPTAATHTYHVRGWKTSAGVTATVNSGAGGASTQVPSYYRITMA